MATTMNNWLAVTPFLTNSTKVIIKDGVAQIDQRNKLAKLNLVLPSKDLPDLQVGDPIWVEGDRCKLYKQVQTLEGVEGDFILIPVSEVRAFSQK